MIKRTKEIIEGINKRGRPVEMDYSKFFDALFFIVDEGSRYSTSYLYGRPKSTFTRHVKYINDHNILEIIYDELIDDLVIPPNNIIMKALALGYDN